MFFFFPFGGGGFGGFILILMFVLLGRVVRNLRSSSYQGYNRTSLSDRAFFDGMFSMLAKLASVDGKISDSAKTRINRFMLNELHLDQSAYNYAWNVFYKALSSSDSFESICDTFYSRFASSAGLLQMTLDIMYSIAMTDGNLSKREENLLDYAASRFRIAQSIVDSIRRKYGVSSTTTNKAYAVLGVSENASVDEIKKAYRKLILEFHPDRVSASGAGEDFKQYATQRFREIQEAYEQICRQRGIK